MAKTIGRDLSYSFCKSVAAKYTSLRDLREADQSVYYKSWKMKWLDEFISEFNYKSHRDLMREHFVASPVNKSGQVYRTNEEIYEIAKRFTKMKVFRSKEPDVYQISLKRKLISQFTWLERANNKSGVPYLDNVYAYEFAETKSVYIGRTVDIERRHEEHCRKPGDTVCKYAT
jgi:hypothetical protein